MKPKTASCLLAMSLLLVLCFFSFGEEPAQAQTSDRGLEGVGPVTHDYGDAAFISNLQEDSSEVAMGFTTGYPGHFAKIELLLKNHLPVAAFQFMITVSNPDVMDFHLDSVGVDTIIIPIDTCTGPGPHGDTCFVDSLVLTPVGYCHIDTVGSLVSGFVVLECDCWGVDTSDSSCDGIEVLGFAYPGDPIPPDSAFRRLFRLGVDLSCMSDSTTDRSVTFYLFPGVNSFLSDPEGYPIPFQYHPGELTAWWSVPGDASNDSLVTASDIVFLINYFFKNGPEPCIMEAADPNGDCVADPADIVYLINYFFKGGDPPVPGCAH
jgi:hypothetical protein